jgi:hypothetical protein
VNGKHGSGAYTAGGEGLHDDGGVHPGV